MYYFTDDCLIGVEMIDREHRELFRIINDIAELLGKEYIEDKYDLICGLLEQLKQYAEEHFKHEEEYMETIRHPELELQRKQHQVFCAKIHEADVLLAQSEQEEFLDDLLKYLVTWLYRHIIGSDLMIGKMESTIAKGKQVNITFSEEFVTGIDLIDEEHRELFRIIGEVQDVIVNDFIPDKFDEIVHLLEELMDYTKFHFADEEKYMESIQYAGLPAQKRAHDAFIARLEEMDLEQIDEHQQETLEEILQFLKDWLINHILYSDKMIGK